MSAFDPACALANFDLFSPWHLLIVLVVCLLLFGRRLPEIMRGLGGSVREFRKGMSDDAPTTPPEAKPPQA